MSWESGDSSTDPTCLQRASLQPSVSRSSQLLQTCTCTSGIFYLTYPYWVQIVICFLNAPPLVLCKQPESVLDRRSDSSLPPLEINAWCVPSALRIEAGSSQVCSHQPPQVPLPSSPSDPLSPQRFPLDPHLPAQHSLIQSPPPASPGSPLIPLASGSHSWSSSIPMGFPHQELATLTIVAQLLSHALPG